MAGLPAYARRLVAQAKETVGVVEPPKPSDPRLRRVSRNKKPCGCRDKDVADIAAESARLVMTVGEDGAG